MIIILFRFGPEVIMVNVDGTRVLFGNTSQGPITSTIDGIKLSKSGVIKEFPDLKYSDNWSKEAAFRFKQKINSLETESERARYIIKDLKSHGYKLWRIQRKGHRPEDISKWDS